MFEKIFNKQEKVYCASRSDYDKYDASFPIARFETGKESERVYSQQYLDWDYCLSEDKNTLILVFFSYYDLLEGFERVYDMLEKSCTIIAENQLLKK